MDKETAKKLLEVPDEALIEFWEKKQDEDYLLLKKTKSPEEIVKKLKELAKDVLAERATVFPINNNGKRYVLIEYLGE